jgi:uncharacterized protein (TIGR02265 family)
MGVVNDLRLLQELSTRYNYDDYKPPFEMSYLTFLAIVEHVRVLMLPDKTREEGYEELGGAILKGFTSGVIGQITKVTSTMLGPVRGAHFLVKNAANTFPFGKHELEEVREGYFRYHYYEVPSANGLLCGLIKAALEMSNVKDVRLTSKKISNDEAIIEATWS